MGKCDEINGIMRAAIGMMLIAIVAHPSRAGAARLQQAAADSTWAVQPWMPPHAEAFSWGVGDAEGARMWRALRLNWVPDESVKADAAVAPLHRHSAWGWWMRAGQAPWLIAGAVLAIALACAARFQRRRLVANTRRPACFVHWPELNAVVAGLPLRRPGAAYAMALHNVHLRLESKLPAVRPGWEVLNASERECAECAMQRMNPAEIAQLMHCTTKHVYNLRSSIRKKLDLPADLDLEESLRQRMVQGGSVV